MKLAFCIPTHHGRVSYLRQLLDSIVSQTGLPDGVQLQICVSDNASQDGTAQMLELYRAACPIPIKYFRFPQDMRGVRNTCNVIEMSDADYCWLMGSDDVVIQGGLGKVLHAIINSPTLAGITVNKLNYDRSLTTRLGPDHGIVLPADASRTHEIDGLGNVMVNLGMAFSYMSAHIFRRDAFLSVVNGYGLEYLKAMRHFSHSFMFSQIAKAQGKWLWIADYCVIQRMGNFCLLEEKDNRNSLYAMEILDDIQKVWASVLDPTCDEFRSLARRQFIVAWNPLNVISFKCEQGLTTEEEREIWLLSSRVFRRVPLFWLTTAPLLILPRRLFCPLRVIRWGYRKLVPQHLRLETLLRRASRVIYRNNGNAKTTEIAAASVPRPNVVGNA